jgi:hypothetical protein
MFGPQVKTLHKSEDLAHDVFALCSWKHLQALSVLYREADGMVVRIFCTT